MSDARDREWLEVSIINQPCRIQFDQNRIEGEPDEACIRHTPPMDRSGQLWMPGMPNQRGG